MLPSLLSLLFLSVIVSRMFLRLLSVLLLSISVKCYQVSLACCFLSISVSRMFLRLLSVLFLSISVKCYQVSLACCF